MFLEVGCELGLFVRSESGDSRCPSSAARIDNNHRRDRHRPRKQHAHIHPGLIIAGHRAQDGRPLPSSASKFAPARTATSRPADAIQRSITWSWTGLIHASTKNSASPEMSTVSTTRRDALCPSNVASLLLERSVSVRNAARPMRGSLCGRIEKVTQPLRRSAPCRHRSRTPPPKWNPLATRLETR